MKPATLSFETLPNGDFEVRARSKHYDKRFVVTPAEAVRFASEFASALATGHAVAAVRHLPSSSADDGVLRLARAH